MIRPPRPRTPSTRRSSSSASTTETSSTASPTPRGSPSGRVRSTRAGRTRSAVGGEGGEAKLRANKQAYAEEFVSRAEFLTRYPLSMTPVDYVNALYAHAGQTPTEEARQAAP